MNDTDSPRRGLYDDFREYRVPAEVELTRALRTATVVVDASVLLNLYRYTTRLTTTCWTCCAGLGTAFGSLDTVTHGQCVVWAHAVHRPSGWHRVGG